MQLWHILSLFLEPPYPRLALSSTAWYPIGEESTGWARGRPLHTGSPTSLQWLTFGALGPWPPWLEMASHRHSSPPASSRSSCSCLPPLVAKLAPLVTYPSSLESLHESHWCISHPPSVVSPDPSENSWNPLCLSMSSSVCCSIHPSTQPHGTFLSFWTINSYICMTSISASPTKLVMWWSSR